MGFLGEELNIGRLCCYSIVKLQIVSFPDAKSITFSQNVFFEALNNHFVIYICSGGKIKTDF